MRKLLVFINFPASSCILTIKQSVFSRFSTLKNLAIDNIDFSRNDFSNTLPCHGQSLKLEVTNSHPLDKNIIFYESNHSYFINKSKAKYSVTNYIGKYFEKFIPETAVQKMITGPNWPRPGYINEDGVPYTEKEIFEQWDRISLNARNRGTWMHYNIEGYLNDLPTCFDVPELQQFHEFYNENVLKTNLQPYRTEWRIAAPDLKLAGSVDFVGQRPDKTYEIIDWKRAQKLEMSLTSQFGKRAK